MKTILLLGVVVLLIGSSALEQAGDWMSGVMNEPGATIAKVGAQATECASNIAATFFDGAPTDAEPPLPEVAPAVASAVETARASEEINLDFELAELRMRAERLVRMTK